MTTLSGLGTALAYQRPPVLETPRAFPVSGPQPGSPGRRLPFQLHSCSTRSSLWQVLLRQPPELPVSSPWGSSLPPFSSRPPGLSSMWEGPSFYPQILSLPSLFSLLKKGQGPGLMTCVSNSGQQTPLSSHQEFQVCVSHCMGVTLQFLQRTKSSEF